MTLLNYLNNLVKDVFENNGYETERMIVKFSDRPDLSHYQCNEAFNIARKLKENPKSIAEKITEILKKEEIFEDVFVAGPGFINFVIKDSLIVKNLEELYESNFDSKVENKKKIIIDYGGANVAKPLHVGHLRSAIIGEGLKRLARELGHEVIGDVHLGDFGRPLGLVISEIKRRKPDLVYFDENYTKEYPKESPVTIDELNEIYPIASQKAKENETFMQEAREITAAIQDENLKGHRGYHALWECIVEESKKDLKKSYDGLGVSFELWRGESTCFKSIPKLLSILNDKKLLRLSEGATIMDIAEETDKKELPPLILKTQNGSFGYQTTDLATIYERMEEFNPDEIWYVVDARQDMHFVQCFRGARKANLVKSDTKLEFIGFGTMNGKDGKPFKTRDGGVMRLSDLLDLVKEYSINKLKESNSQEFTEEELNVTSEKLANATIKYADALSNRLTDYIFDITKFTDTQGKTGPYILYSTVRIKSLLEKAKENNLEEAKLLNPVSEEEKKLMLVITKLNDMLITSYENKALTEIVNYLYDLNSLYNSFYNSNKIIGDDNKEQRSSWIRLSKMVYLINLKLLNILAIEEVEKM